MYESNQTFKRNTDNFERVPQRAQVMDDQIVEITYGVLNKFKPTKVMSFYPQEPSSTDTHLDQGFAKSDSQRKKKSTVKTKY